MRDWQVWHTQYDDPGSTLARRLVVVRRGIASALAERAGRPTVRILSLCAGAGRDLLPELAAARPTSYEAVLVEKDPDLAAEAAAAASSAGLAEVTVITGDAGDPATFAGHPDNDLLLLCGIFGNISEADIRTTVAAAPALLVPGGTVIWTRGSMAPDLRPAIRRWFSDAGIDEVAFDGEPEGFGVGVGRRSAGSAGPPLPDRLFTFVR